MVDCFVFTNEWDYESILENHGDPAATETYFFGIYWDLLKNRYTFSDKSQTIFKVRVRMGQGLECGCAKILIE
jgi:hypothetical protein